MRHLPLPALGLLLAELGVVLLAGAIPVRSAGAESRHFVVSTKACTGGCKVTVALHDGGDSSATVSIIPQASRHLVRRRQDAWKGTLPDGVRLGRVTLKKPVETHTFTLKYGGDLTQGTEFAVVSGWGTGHVWGGVLGRNEDADGVLP